MLLAGVYDCPCFFLNLVLIQRPQAERDTEFLLLRHELSVMIRPPHDDGVKGTVELTISSTAETVPNHPARRGGDWGHAGKRGKGSIRANTSAVRPGADDLCDTDGTDARFSSQRGEPSPLNQQSDLLLAGCSFGTQCFRPSCDLGSDWPVT